MPPPPVRRSVTVVLCVAVPLLVWVAGLGASGLGRDRMALGLLGLLPLAIGALCVWNILRPPPGLRARTADAVVLGLFAVGAYTTYGGCCVGGVFGIVTFVLACALSVAAFVVARPSALRPGDPES